MPTARPRHFVTESDELTAVLDAAEVRWPGLSRAQLLAKLALEGGRAEQLAENARRRRRLALIHEHSGTLTGTYPSDYLEQVRTEWPA